MNLSILNKKKCYFIIYDSDENIILKKKYIKSSRKINWSFLSSTLFLSETKDFLSQKYNFQTKELKFFKHVVIDNENYCFINTNSRLKEIDLTSKLKVFNLSKLLSVNIEESEIHIISKIFEFISIKRDYVIDQFELSLCRQFNLVKKNERVFYSDIFPTQFSKYQGKLLK